MKRLIKINRKTFFKSFLILLSVEIFTVIIALGAEGGGISNFVIKTAEFFMKIIFFPTFYLDQNVFKTEILTGSLFYLAIAFNLVFYAFLIQMMINLIKMMIDDKSKAST